MNIINKFLAHGWLCYLAVVLFLFTTVHAQQSGRFYPGKEWLDNAGVAINAHGGGVIFYQGVYYWYGEHKIAGVKGNKAYVGVHCYSSVDLYHWKDQGVALSVGQDTLAKLTEGCILERPKVLYNKMTRKFVMWFHFEPKGMGYKAALCGVAVSDHVSGPFRLDHVERPDRGYWPLNEPSSRTDPADTLIRRDFAVGQMSRDMNLFQDDDGKAYIIYTSEENRSVHISQLSTDYRRTTGKYVRVFANRYMEAAAVFKKGGRYYFVASGCTGWMPNAARSAVAEHIFGPWTELENPCRGKDNSLTFLAQSNFVLKIEGKKDAYIFMADRWQPKNAVDGRYVWLPVKFNKKGFEISWKESWDLDCFEEIEQ